MKREFTHLNHRDRRAVKKLARGRFTAEALAASAMRNGIPLFEGEAEQLRDYALRGCVDPPKRR